MNDLTDDEIAEAVIAYEAGATVLQIATEYECSSRYIAKILRANEVQIRKRGGLMHPPGYDEFAYTGGWVRDGLIMRPSGAA